MFGLYTFIDRNGDPRIMRASTIHKKIIESSKKSNYNWIASASDLIYICSKKNFPTKYSIDIKIAILNCFAILINSDNPISYSKKTDIKAVYYAYNSLFGIENETAKIARKNFLNGFLSKIRWNSWQFMIHQGDSFTKVCNDWQTSKVNELLDIENLNFNAIKTHLENDFRTVIKEAEKNGVFLDEDMNEEEIQKKLLRFNK